MEESASEQLVHQCLQEYMAACCRLRSVDLQGEFAAFHWQYGDLDDAGWVRRGVVAGFSELEVFTDPTRQIDFVKLVSSPRIRSRISDPGCNNFIEIIIAANPEDRWKSNLS